MRTLLPLLPLLPFTTTTANTRSLQAGFENKNENCLLTDSGYYGTLTRTPLNVQFLYQVDMDVAQGVARSELLPLLDRGIVQGILPSLFDCVPQRRRVLQTTSIIGVSTQVLDSMSSANAGR